MQEDEKFRKRILRIIFFFTILCFDLSLPLAIWTQARNSNFDLTLPLRQCWYNKIISNDNYAVFASDNVLKILEIIDTDNLFFPQSNHSLEYLNSTNGRRLWITDLVGEIVSKPSITNTEIFLVVRVGENYFLRDVSKISGVINWQTKLALPATTGDEIFLRSAANKIIVITKTGNSLALSMENGSVIWQMHSTAKLSAVPAFGKKIFALTGEDNKLQTVSLADGSLTGNYQLTSPITTIIFPTADQIVAGDKKGNVFALSLTNGNKLWKIRNGAEISNINESNAGLLVSSLDNFVYLVSPKSGKILWKKRFPGRIIYKPLLLGNYAVITNVSDSNAVFIDLKSGKIVNRIVFGEGNYFTNNTLLEGNLLIFSNLNSVTGYLLSPDGCQSS